MHNKQYPLGFILSTQALDETEFKHTSLDTAYEHYQTYHGSVNIHYDPNNQFISYMLDNTSLIIIGDIYDIGRDDTANTSITNISSHLSSSQLAARLFEALQQSEALFFQALKHVWGRFALIYSTKKLGTHILTDATSMRGIFYAQEDAVICASHPYMLSNKNVDDPFPIRYGYPGNLTPIEGVKILTPNTRLCLTTGQLSRFYPGLMPISSSKVKTIQEVATLFINSSSHILQQLVLAKPKICVTLTGGLDSRVTLALLLLAVPDKIAKIKFITYKNQNRADFDTDVETTRILAKRYRLDHQHFYCLTCRGVRRK